MLMHARNDPLDPRSMTFPLLVSEKLDGWRCLVIGGACLSKSVIDHANRNLTAHLAALIELGRGGWVFDCELWSPEMSLEEIQSVLQSRTAPIPDHLQAHLFDCLTINEWFNSRVPRFQRRYDRCRELLEQHRPARAQAVRHDLVLSAADLMRRYEQTLDNGGEGLMLRDPAGGYHHGRCRKSDRIVWKLKPATITKPAPCGMALN
jgi:ATP-dependent DNA ligase